MCRIATPWLLLFVEARPSADDLPRQQTSDSDVERGTQKKFHFCVRCLFRLCEAGQLVHYVRRLITYRPPFKHRSRSVTSVIKTKLGSVHRAQAVEPIGELCERL